MKVAILGGGFGIYGYLPALAACGATPVLPFRYRETLAGRPDVKAFLNAVKWGAQGENDEELISRCKGIIMALPPARQVGWAEHCLAQPSISYLLLEKPLAVTPAQAQTLLMALRASHKTFRIGYNFRHTPWGKALLAPGTAAPIRIQWSFRAHHYLHQVDTWKRHHSKGGGALRFFGIHLVALLAERGYTRSVSSQIKAALADEAESWQAVFTGPGLPDCHVEVNTNAGKSAFAVTDAHGHATLLNQPFQGVTPSTGGDQRIPLLQEILADLLHGPAQAPAWYEASLALWQSVETATVFSK